MATLISAAIKKSVERNPVFITHNSDNTIFSNLHNVERSADRNITNKRLDIDDTTNMSFEKIEEIDFAIIDKICFIKFYGLIIALGDIYVPKFYKKRGPHKENLIKITQHPKRAVQEESDLPQTRTACRLPRGQRG